MDFGLSSNKRENPRENASIFSVITLFYTFPTFFEGRKRDFEVSDLYQTYSNHKSKLLGDKIELAWRQEEERAAKRKSKPSLKRVLIKLYGLQFMWQGLFCCVVEFVARLVQPLFLGKLISYYSHDDPPMTKVEAYGYAGGVIGCSLLSVLIIHPYVLSVLHVGMKMRVACCSLVYRKALRLSKTTLGRTTIGQMVNLLSNDVNRFDVAVLFAHYFYIGPIQSIMVTYFMYQEVGISAVLGVISLFLFIPLQLGLAKMIGKFRFRTATRTDERVRLMNEVIAGIQVIKMYAWEKPFAKFVSFTRRHEIDSIRGASYIRAIILSFMLFATRVSLFVTILSYVLFGEKITAKKVFVVTAFYNLLRQAMTNFFPQAVSQISEAIVSINRLNNFMLYEEKAPVEDEVHNQIPQANGNIYKEHTFTQDNSNHAVVIEKGFAKWGDELGQDYIFEDLNIKIKRGSVVAIIGPVGSGKSSLLQVILKELPLLKGKLEVHGDIGYASQEPWLFTGTVRQNIVFNRPYDNLRYRNVVIRCSLKRDFSLLPNADKTVVGDRGVSLSGGQRARINLARAVYQEADIYLLDDPLSAVDTHVGRELFDQCIMRYLKGKTVILVTHQLQFLKDVDHIIILDSGSIKAQGTFDELQKYGLDFAKMLKNELDVREEKEPRKMSRDSSVISTTSMDNISGEVAVKDNEEQRTKGGVSSYVYRMYLVAGNSWFSVFCIALMFLLAQLTASFGDVFITYWVNTEEKRFNLTESVTPDINSDNKTTQPIIVPQNISSNIWNYSTETSIYVYTIITSIIVVLAITRSISFFYACMRTSVKLHDNMFNSIINASMRFFNTNSSGRILNRFSKDMGAIDELLPTAILDCVQIFLVLFGIIAVVGSVNPWLLIPTSIIAIIFYFFRCFYLSTSRSVKRLEGVTRSPVFAHLNASLQGLTTIRALGAERTLINEFDELQDLHSVTWFLFISTSRAFGYWLDLVCVIYIALVTLSFLLLGDGVMSGNVGLAITQSLGLTGMFQWGMRQSAEMENQMTSVERVLEYNKIEHERALESTPKKKPPDTWPSRGEIKFVKLFLNYFPEDPPVLVNLNFTIKPLEKVGIVGRTGAGKSSLINALFQLTDVKGSILVDGVDITEIGLHDLRCKFSIIPQEPVLFSGTLRKNLDPFDEYSDIKLWTVLEDVELKEAAEDLSLGLNGAVLEGGTNFSVGQRQLICLARAILRNNKILILDEATANIDPQTDGLIQSTIRKKFAQCTVLTIAHRLNTVMDSDKVLVMDAGRMVEFDHPFNLLQNEDGIFYGMVQQTGKAMAESLRTIALNSYKAKDRQSVE